MDNEIGSDTELGEASSNDWDQPQDLVGLLHASPPVLN